MTVSTVFKRNHDLHLLNLLVKSPRSEFLYVRGRRRVGKSWLLQQLSNKYPKEVFYFSGAKDIRNQACLRQFVQEWSDFSSSTTLKEIRTSDLHWKRVFDSITDFSKKNKNGITLIFDEIQWIAKEGSGFVGKLKEAWVSWEKSKKIRVIVCGSSNRFFEQKSGGEEKILRGLRTQADIFIEPIPFEQVKAELVSKWNFKEASILYMMTGGIPYYLAQIDNKKPFITAVNDAFFTSRSIFLDELDEVLNLDFNKKGLSRTKLVLQAIGNHGATPALILKKTKLSDSTISDILEKLSQYKIISRLSPTGLPKGKKIKGHRYIINDPFIATYFTLLLPIENEIKLNLKEILFTKYYLLQKAGYYIENYTGYAFERMIRQILNERNLALKIFHKLDIRSKNFEITQYWDETTQIDLIVNDRTDRISRTLEIKWLSDYAINFKKLQSELEIKEYPCPNGYYRKNFLILGTEKNKNNFTITLEDLCKGSK